MKMTKNPAVVNYRRFPSYKSAVVNYNWSVFSHFHVFLGNNESQKSNSPIPFISLGLDHNLSLYLSHYTIILY